MTTRPNASAHYDARLFPAVFHGAGPGVLGHQRGFKAGLPFRLQLVLTEFLDAFVAQGLEGFSVRKINAEGSGVGISLLVAFTPLSLSLTGTASA